MYVYFAAFTKITKTEHYQSPTYVAKHYSNFTQGLAICTIQTKRGKDSPGTMCKMGLYKKVKEERSWDRKQ